MSMGGVCVNKSTMDMEKVGDDARSESDNFLFHHLRANKYMHVHDYMT